jgi:hypothetical protein
MRSLLNPLPSISRWQDVAWDLACSGLLHALPVNATGLVHSSRVLGQLDWLARVSKVIPASVQCGDDIAERVRTERSDLAIAAIFATPKCDVRVKAIAAMLSYNANVAAARKPIAQPHAALVSVGVQNHVAVIPLPSPRSASAVIAHGMLLETPALPSSNAG